MNVLRSTEKATEGILVAFQAKRNHDDYVVRSRMALHVVVAKIMRALACVSVSLAIM